MVDWNLPALSDQAWPLLYNRIYTYMVLCPQEDRMRKRQQLFKLLETELVMRNKKQSYMQSSDSPACTPHPAGLISSRIPPLDNWMDGHCYEIGWNNRWDNSRCRRVDREFIDDSQMLWDMSLSPSIALHPAISLTPTRRSPSKGTKRAASAREQVFKPPDRKQTRSLHNQLQMEKSLTKDDNIWLFWACRHYGSVGWMTEGCRDWVAMDRY